MKKKNVILLHIDCTVPQGEQDCGSWISDDDFGKAVVAPSASRSYLAFWKNLQYTGKDLDVAGIWLEFNYWRDIFDATTG